jgi:hypothetical protein
VANLTGLGYVGLKEGWGASALLLAPLVPLVEAYRAYAAVAFARPGALLSREAAARADRSSRRARDGAGGGGGGGLLPPAWVSFDPNLYRQPALDQTPLRATYGGAPPRSRKSDATRGGHGGDSEREEEEDGDEEEDEDQDQDEEDGKDGQANGLKTQGGGAVEMAGAVAALAERPSRDMHATFSSPLLQLVSEGSGSVPVTTYRSTGTGPVSCLL